MSMTKSKMWTAGAALVCVLLLVASWFLLIDPVRADAAQVREQTQTQERANTQLRARIATLEEQFKNLPRLKLELDAVREAMPADVAESSLLREVQGLATGTGTTFISVTAGEPAPRNLPSAPDAAAQEKPQAKETEAGPTSDTVVWEVPVTFVATSTFQGSQAFLQKMQDQMPRALLVNDLSIAAREPGKGGNGKPAASNGDVEMTITGHVFVLQAPDFDLDGTIGEMDQRIVVPPADAASDDEDSEPLPTEAAN
ncbi:MAG: hypothetical protein CSA58_07640 [Micrococcales bacterium]|nr:MAG: hypothetical protein CSA58_07640 [Micrococcales bacterium]